MPGSRRSRLTLQRMFAFLANGYSTLQETCRVTTKVRSHFATACLIDRSGAADTHGSRRFVLCRRKLQAASCLVARHPRDKLPRVGWPFRAPFRAVRRGRRTKSTVTFNDDLTATMSAQASRSHRYVMNCFNRPTGRPGRAILRPEHPRQDSNLRRKRLGMSQSLTKAAQNRAHFPQTFPRWTAIWRPSLTPGRVCRMTFAPRSSL